MDDENERYADVLDHGYVRLLDWMGDDLTVVNAARASYEKRSKWEYVHSELVKDDVVAYKLSDRDTKLVAYLAKHGHISPFRHCTLQFEVKAPLLVARQWWRYVVGSDHTMDGWNEQSRRYVDSEPEFYIPEVWRGRATTNKQGSVGALSPEQCATYTDHLRGRIYSAVEEYEWALKDGIAPEQARLFLPAYAMYTTWQWTCSLQSLAHFLNQRLDEHAQWEIRQYAKAVEEITRPLFPVSLENLLEKQGE